MFLSNSLNSQWKEFLLTLILAIGCLLVYSLFPSNNFSQDFTKGLVFLFIVPLLFIKYILKKDLSQFGLNLRNKKEGLIWTITMLVLSILILLAFSQLKGFKNEYVLPNSVYKNFLAFVFYELFMVNMLLFSEEYFFKGFVLSFLREKTGAWSILIQSIAYSIPLFLFSVSYWQVLPMIVISLTGGIVAYKSRSFFYSYLMSLAFIIFSDAYIIFLNK